MSAEPEAGVARGPRLPGIALRNDAGMLEIAAALVKRALAGGAEAAEAFLLDVRTTTLSAEGEYMRPTEMSSEGLGLRIIAEGRFGNASKHGFTDPTSLIANALRSAAQTRAQALGGFSPPIAGGLPDVADPFIARGEEAHIGDFVERASARLRSLPDVTYARVAAQDSVRRFAIANSLGLEAIHVSTSERIEIEARVTRGTSERTAADSWTGAARADASVDPEALADAAVADARGALDPRPLPASVDRVIFAPSPASRLVAIASTAFSGVGVQAGKSPWETRLGERIASDAITITDDPREVGGRSRLAIDDEGTPTRSLTLVDKGILRSFVHTRATAAHAGCEPTGSAGRKSVDAPLIPRPVSLAVANGDRSLDALVESEDRAVLVTQPLMGAFVASRVTGDFSLVAPFAYYVERGRIRHALPPTTLGGNAHRFLETVDGVGNDGRVFLAGRVPTLRAGGISCAT